MIHCFKNPLSILTLVCIITCACTNPSIPENTVASVYAQKLTDDQLKSALGEKAFNNSDYKAQFVDSWIKKQLLLQEAKKNQKFNKEINQLVKDYKESLLIQKHKETYLDKNLDKEISSVEMDEAYALIKEDYKLAQKIFKMELVVTPADHFDKLDLKNYFKKGDFDNWKNSLSNLVDLHLQDTTRWYNWGQMEQYIPPGLLKEESLEANDEYFLENSEYLFFVRIFELIDENEIAPLSYMSDKLKKAILEKRKEALLNDYSATLYKTALQNNNIKQ